MLCHTCFAQLPLQRQEGPDNDNEKEDENYVRKYNMEMQFSDLTCLMWLKFHKPEKGRKKKSKSMYTATPHMQA